MEQRLAVEKVSRGGCRCMCALVKSLEEGMSAKAKAKGSGKQRDKDSEDGCIHTERTLS